MPRRFTPPSAAPLAIGDALRASEPLGRLTERLRRSNAFFAAIRGLLPSTLAAHVAAGPADDEGWSLLCANAAVAAKLRQLVPHLEQHLRAAGHAVAAVRIKVQPR
ncbi:MAG: hypothetical protein ABIO71_08155 [Caldimonas sp.]